MKLHVRPVQLSVNAAAGAWFCGGCGKPLEGVPERSELAGGGPPGGSPAGAEFRVNAITLGHQYVVAVAEMSDGTLLMTETWVEVATNGCK
mgnify:CR=1 FL=1